MYYDINLRSNWSEPSKVDSLPSLSPKLPSWLKWSYSPGWWWLGCPPTQWWSGIRLPSCQVTWSGSGGLPPSTRQTLSGWGEAEHNRVQSCCKSEAFTQTYLSFALCCNIQYESQDCLTETILTHAAFWQIPKYPFYPLSPPFVNVGFQASICSSAYLKKGHFKILLYISTFTRQKG